MLLDVGCEWVILGHSERRKLYGETSGIFKCWRVATEIEVHTAVVAAKIAAALQHKNGDGSARLRVIACVGETLEERQAGNTMQVSRFRSHFPVPGIFVVTLFRWCLSSFLHSKPTLTPLPWSLRTGSYSSFYN